MEEAARDTEYVKWVLSRKSPVGGLAKFVAYLQDNGHQATIDHGQSEADDNAWIEHCIEHSIETDQDYFDDEYDLQEDSHYEIIRPDGKVLRLPNDGKLRCDVCGKACKDEKALNKHYRIHIRERNKRSGVGNGKKPNKKPRRNGKHALLPPRSTRRKQK